MPPYVNPERAHAAAAHPYASTSTAGGEFSARGNSASRGRGRGRGGANHPGTIPTGSLSKLKAQLRQTTRLLAKEDLTPDVRITSERRLQSLQIEIAKTTTSNLEQKMVTRYRGVKFFERQKILRKIKQTKKSIASDPADATLVQTLLESRIDLYYILKYPKTEKYVSLFPEGNYVAHSDSAGTTTDGKDAASVRANLRTAQKVLMERGDLAAEPEGGDLGIEGEEDVGTSTDAVIATTVAPLVQDSVPEPETAVMTVEKDKKVKKAKSVPVIEAEETVADEEMVNVEEQVAPVGEKKMNKRDRKADKKSKLAAGEAVPVVETAAGPTEGWAAAGDDFFA